MNHFALVLSLLISTSFSWADVRAEENAPLDPPYRETHRPLVLPPHLSENLDSQQKVDHLMTARLQSAVKSQGRRGTCSIFSSTALLEFHLKKLGLAAGDPDLSEQWLEYLTAGQSGSEGSWSTVNFRAYGEHGYVNENTWSYVQNTWTPYNPGYWEFAPEMEKNMFVNRCLPLQGGMFFEHCLIGHRDPQLLEQDDATLSQQLIEDPATGQMKRNPFYDPEFVSIRSEGAASVENLAISSVWVNSNNEAQKLLDQGEAITLDVTFFYEAWNHSKAGSIGLGRDGTLWSQGVVSFPHPDSKDYQVSRESANAAGHSIVIVGYDRDLVLERQVMKVDGTLMTVKTKGVYFFKNSWGDNSFGVDFQLKGQSLPGFGMISMDYAHQHGSFARMSVRRI